MDEMNIKLSTKFMRNIVAKLLSKFIYKKVGYKIDIQLDSLDVRFIDGETRISANVEAKLNSEEFKKIIKASGLDD